MSDDNSRKATQVLLDIEAKINSMLSLLQSQDFSMKLLSNKITAMEEVLKQKPDFRIEAEQTFKAPTPKDEIIDSEFFITQEEFPNTNRRGTRNDVAVKKPNLKKKDPTPAIVVDTTAQPSIINKSSGVEFRDYDDSLKSDSEIPVSQKVVDRVGKAVLLADVEIRNKKTNKIDKIRTNMVGKWMHPLPVGSYDITITKRELNTTNKKQVKQTLLVDGTKLPLNLEEIMI